MLVIGIDVSLTRTGVAAIREGKAAWFSTISVPKEDFDTGPRYGALREGLQRLFERMVKEPPDVVAIEQPELNVRKGRGVEAILKLYGAFAVAFAECQRLWPTAKVVGVTPRGWKGNLEKGLTARIMAAKYRIDSFENDHEADGLGLADWAWDHLKIILKIPLTER